MAGKRPRPVHKSASRPQRAAKKRQSTYRKPEDRAAGKFTGTHHCPECGKWCFATRDDAVAGARYFHPGVKMRYYRCPDGSEEVWHYTSGSRQGRTGNSSDSEFREPDA